MNADLTAPVEAAARAAFEEGRKQAAALLPPKTAEKLSQWEDIGPVQQNQWRQGVLPIVQAAVSAIPEPEGPGSTAWLEALMAGPQADTPVD